MSFQGKEQMLYLKGKNTNTHTEAEIFLNISPMWRKNIYMKQMQSKEIYTLKTRVER